MGLLSRLSGNTATLTKTFGDDVHLLHGMMLMAAADGVLEEGEWNTLRGFWHTLPEFRGKDFQQVYNEAQKLCARFGTLQESVKALADIENQNVRNKCFVIAADLAMSSGDIDHAEDQMLESMQRVLNISDNLAKQVLEVLAMKYAR